jgi:alkylhydroperoxidase family enzyme
MSRIEPVPPSELDQDAWDRVVRGAEAGYASVEFAGILAYHRELFDAHVQRLGTRTPGTLLGPRLSELIRLRSAQLGGCEQCQAARYEDSVGDEEFACMTMPASDQFSAREQAALEFVRLMHVDHFSIGDGTYQTLHEHFTVAEIVELGTMTAGFLGTHRFMRTLDLLGAARPAIAYDPADTYRGTTVGVK